MPGIQSRADLRTAIKDWTIRSDLTDSELDRFIDNAESRFKRDRRIREVQSETKTVSNQTETLPTDYKALISLYHDGPTYFGEIEIVSPGQLGDVEESEGETGVPSHAALLGNTIRFAPVPDDDYDLQLVYWASIDPLSDSVLSNWLLADHPDIYLYGALVETAPYLEYDERLPMWEAELERRIEQLHQQRDNEQYGGSLRRRVENPIP